MSSPDRTSASQRSRPDSRVMERLVLLHFSTLLVVTTWAFGGQAPWARQAIAWWGGLGLVLFLSACLRHDRSAGGRAHPALRHLWPLWLYDAVVIASCFNPGFREAIVAGEPSLVMGNPLPWLPSAARPLLAARELWQFNVIMLSCFNLFLILNRRRLIRAALLVVCGNAAVLAVFGTFQKLIGSEGLWFGLVPSPNPKFFSTFVYHNHWGAFTVMNTAACLGLVFHHMLPGGRRDGWHSPVLLGALGMLLLAATVPLSASRSCTVLVSALLVGALAHFLTRVARRRRERHESAMLPVMGIVLAAVLATAAVGYLSREVITQRARLTSAQFSQIGQESSLNSRLTLYRDTWRMASARPWFGWGLESFAQVFRVYNTQRAAEVWIWIPFYAEAHSDWLQSLAEVGFAGTSLLVLLALLPLASVPWRQVRSAIPRYLLAGCGLVVLYAWVEFPFANPAVMLTFWAAFYCAIRYAGLDARRQQETTR